MKDLLPGRIGSVEVTAAGNRLLVEAVLYCYCAGILCTTCRSASVIGRTCIAASVAGPNPGSGSVSFAISPRTPIINTR